MQTFSCAHVRTGAEAVSVASVRVLDGAPPMVDARRHWIEAEVQLCSLCTATTRVFLDSTNAESLIAPVAKEG